MVSNFAARPANGFPAKFEDGPGVRFVGRGLGVSAQLDYGGIAFFDALPDGSWDVLIQRRGTTEFRRVRLDASGAEAAAAATTAIAARDQAKIHADAASTDAETGTVRAVEAAASAAAAEQFANAIEALLGQIGDLSSAIAQVLQNAGLAEAARIAAEAASAIAVTKAAEAAASLDGRVTRARRALANISATLAASDSYVGIASITASRTITLPAAASFPLGQPLYIADETGALSASVTITVQAAGSDTIAGEASFTMASPWQKVVLHSNGSNLWTY